MTISIPRGEPERLWKGEAAGTPRWCQAVARKSQRSRYQKGQAAERRDWGEGCFSKCLGGRIKASTGSIVPQAITGGIALPHPLPNPGVWSVEASPKQPSIQGTELGRLRERGVCGRNQSEDSGMSSRVSQGELLSRGAVGLVLDHCASPLEELWK